MAGQIAVVVEQVGAARLALAAAIATGSTALIAQRRQELGTALHQLNDAVSVFSGGQASDEVQAVMSKSAAILAMARRYSLSQTQATKKCQAIQVQIAVHLGKMAATNPPPPDWWDHWVKEINNWVEQQQAKLKNMGRRTQQTWQDQIDTNLKNLQDQIDRMQSSLVVTMRAISSDLLDEHHNGKLVVNKMSITTDDGVTFTRWKYTDSTSELQRTVQNEGW